MKLSFSQFNRYGGSHGRQIGWKAARGATYKIRGRKSPPAPKQTYKKYKAPK